MPEEYASRPPTFRESVAIFLWMASDPHDFQAALTLGNNWENVVEKMENHATAEGIHD